ncbi:MAG: heavy metal translocating P-type ATPase [Sulfurovum sp.]
MFIEAGFVIAIYFGFRLKEKKEKKYPKKRPKIYKNMHDIKKERNAVSKDMIFDKKELTKEDEEKRLNRNLKVSSSQLVVAGVRHFYPPIAPLYLALYTYSSFSFFRNAEKSLKNKKINNDVLTTVMSLVALGTGQYIALGILNVSYSIGDAIISKTRRGSESILANSFDTFPNKVWCVKNGIEIEFDLEDIKEGDVVIISIGDTIVIDGVVVDGTAIVDQHTLTGESQPAEKTIGDRVFASTLLVNGKIYVKAEKTGKETTISNIDNLLNNSINFKSKIQLKGDQWANNSALPFLVAAGVGGIVFNPAIGLLISSASYGNGIRILAPLVTYTHTKIASMKGVLVKDGRIFEKLEEVDTILFDKTGTLTNDVLKVGDIEVYNDYSKTTILKYAAAAECKMTHPIAKAILSEAKKLDLDLPHISEANYKIGFGINVKIEDKLIQVGSQKYMKLESIEISQEIEHVMYKVHEEGNSLIMLAVNKEIVGTIEIKATVRPEVQALIHKLREEGIKNMSIVSGDHEQPTKRLANLLGLDGYYYDVLPQDKASIVEKLKKEGKIVCFVGDGVNDVIAMKKADVSISLMGATVIATDVADVILMDGSLTHISDLINASKNLDRDLNKMFKTSIIPSGIILLTIPMGLGFTTAMILKNMIFAMNLRRAFKPLKDYRKLELEKMESEIKVNE